MESNQMKDKNMAAIRAVVAELAYAILPDNYRGDIWLHKLLELQRQALIALSKPARQCDVGTPDEQLPRFVAAWESAHRSFVDRRSMMMLSVFSRWAQMPYNEEGRVGVSQQRRKEAKSEQR